MSIHDIVDALWDIIREIAFVLAQAFIDSTGLFEGKPEYVIGLAIIFTTVYWKLS